MFHPFHSSLKTKLIAAIMIMILMVAGFPVSTASAAVCTSTGTGLWSSAATWSCGYVPTASDDVMIADGTTVTLDVASATVNSLTVNDGLDTTGLTIAGTNALTVNQNVYVVNSTGGGIVHSVNVGAGTLNVGGDLDLNYTNAGNRLSELLISTGTVTINGNLNTSNLTNSQVIFTGSGTLNVGGNFQNGGTLTISTGTVNYTGAAQSVGSYKYYNLGLSGSGVKTLQVGTTTVGGNLTLSGTASATQAAANLTVTGALSVGSGATFTTSPANTFTVTGNVIAPGTGVSTIDGSLILAGTGAKTFTGNLTIDNGGVYNETGIATLVNAGNLTNNGTYIANTGPHTFSGAGKTIGGANVISIPTATFSGTYTNSGSLADTTLTVTGAFTNSGAMTVGTLTVTGVTLTNNGTLTASTALTGSGRVTQGANATLNIGGTSTITNITATAAGNVVNYTGANQTVKPVAYYNLVLSGSGADIMGGAITINPAGNLSIAPTGAVTATLTSNLTDAGTLTLGGVGQVGGGTTYGGTGSGAAHIIPHLLQPDHQS